MRAAWSPPRRRTMDGVGTVQTIFVAPPDSDDELPGADGLSQINERVLGVLGHDGGFGYGLENVPLEDSPPSSLRPPLIRRAPTVTRENVSVWTLKNVESAGQDHRRNFGKQAATSALSFGSRPTLRIETGANLDDSSSSPSSSTTLIPPSARSDGLWDAPVPLKPRPPLAFLGASISTSAANPESQREMMERTMALHEKWNRVLEASSIEVEVVPSTFEESDAGTTQLLHDEDCNIILRVRLPYRRPPDPPLLIPELDQHTVAVSPNIETDPDVNAFLDSLRIKLNAHLESRIPDEVTSLADEQVEHRLHRRAATPIWELFAGHPSTVKPQRLRPRAPSFPSSDADARRQAYRDSNPEQQRRRLDGKRPSVDQPPKRRPSSRMFSGLLGEIFIQSAVSDDESESDEEAEQHPGFVDRFDSESEVPADDLPRSSIGDFPRSSMDFSSRRGSGSIYTPSHALFPISPILPSKDASVPRSNSLETVVFEDDARESEESAPTAYSNSPPSTAVASPAEPADLSMILQEPLDLERIRTEDRRVLTHVTAGYGHEAHVSRREVDVRGLLSLGQGKMMCELIEGEKTGHVVLELKVALGDKVASCLAMPTNAVGPRPRTVSVLNVATELEIAPVSQLASFEELDASLSQPRLLDDHSYSRQSGKQPVNFARASHKHNTHSVKLIPAPPSSSGKETIPNLMLLPPPPLTKPVVRKCQTSVSVGDAVSLELHVTEKGLQGEGMGTLWDIRAVPSPSEFVVQLVDLQLNLAGCATLSTTRVQDEWLFTIAATRKTGEWGQHHKILRKADVDICWRRRGSQLECQSRFRAVLDLTPDVPAAPLIPLKVARKAMVVSSEIEGVVLEEEMVEAVKPVVVVPGLSSGVQLKAAFELGILVMSWHVNASPAQPNSSSTLVQLTIQLTNRSSSLTFRDLALRIPSPSSQSSSVKKITDWTRKALLADPMVAFDSRTVDPTRTVTARVLYSVPLINTTKETRTAWKLADAVQICKVVGDNVEEVLESRVEGGVVIWV